MLAGMSTQEAARYRLDPPETEDQQNREKWDSWKTALETLGVRNY